MNFDLRPHLTLDPANSQQAQGGVGKSENCTWSVLADTMADYGLGRPYDDQGLRDLDNVLEQTPGYEGGETFYRNFVVLSTISPDLAALTAVEFPADIAAAMRSYGAQGFMVHGGSWCTPNAVYTAGNLWGGLSHAWRIVYADDGGIAVWNPWTGYLVYQPDGFWNASYDTGGLLVFHRSLIPEDDMYTDADRNLVQAIANKVLADPGYRFGLDPGDPSSPYYPGTANAWGWKYSDWYVDQHPELNLSRGLQHGPVPKTGAYTTQWGFIDEIADADKDAPRLAEILAAVKAITVPADSPTDLSPVTNRLDALWTAVAAIKAKTDKDLG